MHKHRWSLALVAALTASSASANMSGYPQCREGEEVRMVVRTTWASSYMMNAQRGDVVLTAGGHGLPRVILDALGQDYNHVLLVSEGVAANGHTLLTHDTGINLGEQSLIWFGALPIGVQPDVLRRMVPGNVERDTAQTLLTGSRPNCNAFYDVATCNQLRSRPENLWHSSLLVRANPAVVTGTSIANAAEALNEGDLLYSLGAYSNYTAALNATGLEAPFGRGTMCSGFAALAVNTALAQQGLAPQLTQRLYSEAERDAATAALWNVFVSQNPLTPLVPEIPTQVINCFAQGGACNDPLFIQPRGTGQSISGQDLFDQSTAQLGQAGQWAQQVIPAQWGGGYPVDHFDHFECCAIGTNNCRRMDEAVPVRLNHPYKGLPDLVATGGTLPPGVTPDSVRDTEKARELLAGIFARDGRIEEGDSAVCYVTDGPSVCAELPAVEKLPPRAQHVQGKPTTTSPAVPVIEDVGEGLIADVVVPAAVCAGDVFAVDVVTYDPARLRVSINGLRGETAAIAAPGPLPSPVVVYATDGAGHEQLLTRAVEVIDCGSPEGSVMVAAHRLPHDDDAFRFDVTNDALAAPVTYAWDFGDGTSTTTTAPRTHHAYARRVQDRDAHAYLVNVHARDAEGHEATAQVSVHLKNTFAAAAQASGVWTLRAETTRQPRFKNGQVLADVDVTNIAPVGPFVATAARLTTQPCNRALKPVSVDLKPAAINAAFVVDSGSTQTLRVKLPVPPEQKTAVCRYDLTMTGRVGEVKAEVPVSIETGLFDGTGDALARAATVRRFTRLATRFGDEQTTPTAASDVVDGADLLPTR